MRVHTKSMENNPETQFTEQSLNGPAQQTPAATKEKARVNPRVAAVVIFAVLALLVASLAIILTGNNTTPVASNPTSSRSSSQNVVSLPQVSVPVAASSASKQACTPFSETLSYGTPADLSVSFCKPATATVSKNTDSNTSPWWEINVVEAGMAAKIWTFYEVGVKSYAGYNKETLSHSQFGLVNRLCKTTGDTFDCNYMTGDLVDCKQTFADDEQSPCGNYSIRLGAEYPNDYFVYTCKGKSQSDLDLCDKLLLDLKVVPIPLGL